MPTSSSLTPPPKKAEELQNIAIKGIVGDGKGFNTKDMMIALARAQHHIPSTVPDDNPNLKRIAVIEKKATKWVNAKPSNIDRTLSKINEKIIQIGSAETRPALQLQNKYTQEVGMIKADFDQIARGQNALQTEAQSSLENKNRIIGQISEALAKGEEPDDQQLKKVDTDFQKLTQKADKLAVEEERFSSKLTALQTEVTQTAEAITGPSSESSTYTPE